MKTEVGETAGRAVTRGGSDGGGGSRRREERRVGARLLVFRYGAFGGFVGRWIPHLLVVVPSEKSPENFLARRHAVVLVKGHAGKKNTAEETETGDEHRF